MGILDKKLDLLQALYIFHDRPTGGGATTLSAAAAEGATSFDVVSATNLAAGDDIRVGSGETNELVRIASVASSTITIEKALNFDHASGEAVVEQSAFIYGLPEADGFRLNWAGENVDVFTAVSRMAYGVLKGYIDLAATWRFPTVTVDSIALSLGIPRADVIGNGTSAAQTGTVGPRLFTGTGQNFSALRNASLVAVGKLKDATHFKLSLCNLSFDPTVLSLVLARGQLATVPCRAMASSAKVEFISSVFTPSNVIDLGATKGDIFASIESVYRQSDSGTATTASGNVAAGAYAIPLTSATGVSAGTILKIGTGQNTEYHEVHSLASTTANLRTKVVNAHASGTAVVVQTLTRIGIAQGGLTIASSGGVQVDRSEENRVSLGLTPNNVKMAISGNLDTMTPESFMLGLNISPSDYVGNVLPIGNNVGMGGSVSLLFRGLTQSGKAVVINGWSGDATVTGEIQLTQAAVAQIPFNYAPSTVQVYEFA